jgi:outer membrane cobalamin receptor
VIINGSLLFRGETKDRIIEANGENRIVNLEGFPDLNGGLEYRLTKKISIFGQVNNLLNKQYQTYLYYPSYGFNIFAGVGFGF